MLVPDPPLRSSPDRIAPRGATWLSALGLVAVLIVTIWRVTATYEVFSHTVDEPAHIAAGNQFFDKGRAEGDLTHSPLARIAVAIGPRLLAADGLGCAVHREEQLMQCEGERYTRTLSAARLGTLPFLVLMLVTVWTWGLSSGGPAGGFLAVLLLANLPPVLAHAGLATTDAAAAATLALTLFVFLRWLQRPTSPRAVLLGVAGGLAVGSKLSALAFLPAAGLAMGAVMLWRLRPAITAAQFAGQIAAALGTAALVLWAIYGFTLNPIVGPNGLIDESAGAPDLLRRGIFPLVEVARGVAALTDISRTGLPSYFMGEIREDGWWFFFPVMIAVKTPLPFLALFLAGAVAAARERRRRPALLATAAGTAAILAVAMTSRLNIGLRHVLAIYPLMSVVAGVGAAEILRIAPRHAAAPALLLTGWLLVDAARAHPDYIPYFNEAARGNAAYFSADSDFDWGQDAKRLAAELARRRIDRAAVAVNSTLKLAKIAPVEAADLWPGEPASGWVAAGIGRILDDRIRPPYLGLRWLACHRPVGRIGKTILLYDIAPGTARVGAADCGLGNLAAGDR
jgi:hypothetical protein